MFKDVDKKSVDFYFYFLDIILYLSFILVLWYNGFNKITGEFIVNESKNVNKIITFLFLFSVSLIAFNTGRDYVDFQNALTSQYKTPWYSNTMVHPYTTIRLKFADEQDIHEYWTKNAIGSEEWHVRDVKVGDTTFWTLLERKPVDNQ